mmetsp:Transcript_42730/g.69286  ORF Transcript_42730/g.69286 Transcript_42730/m.69286 type:complete len:113 (-) Transcript_42730:860-1198(-)
MYARACVNGRHQEENCNTRRQLTKQTAFTILSNVSTFKEHWRLLGSLALGGVTCHLRKKGFQKLSGLLGFQRFDVLIYNGKISSKPKFRARLTVQLLRYCAQRQNAPRILSR